MTHFAHNNRDYIKSLFWWIKIILEYKVAFCELTYYDEVIILEPWICDRE